MDTIFIWVTTPKVTYILKGDLFLFRFWKYWPFILWIMTRTQNNLIDLLTKINIIYPQFRVPICIRYDSSHPVLDIWCNILWDKRWPMALCFGGALQSKVKTKMLNCKYWTNKSMIKSTFKRHFHSAFTKIAYSAQFVGIC